MKYVLIVLLVLFVLGIAALLLGSCIGEALATGLFGP
jgi:hypothetical protein